MHNLDQAFANPALISDEGYQAPQNFLILGLGESGYAMAKWCLRNSAKVSLADTRDRTKLNERQKGWLSDLECSGLKDVYFGALNNVHLENIDVIGISPGLSPLHEPTTSFLARAQELSIDIWGEL